MNLRIILFYVILSMATIAQGQGTLLYDQQSSTDETPPIFGEGVRLSDLLPPYGQSFTPTLSSVGFIRLKFDDAVPSDLLGATVVVNLRAGSISGTILGTTAPVSMPDRFRGTADFFFSTPIAVTPGVEYFYEPVQQSGGYWCIVGGPYNYPGGTAWYGGARVYGSDEWFREGIVVPEPGVYALLGLGACLLLCRRKSQGMVRAHAPAPAGW